MVIVIGAIEMFLSLKVHILSKKIHKLR